MLFFKKALANIRQGGFLSTNFAAYTNAVNEGLNI